MTEAGEKPKIKLAVIGAGGCGKSCLVLRFVSDAFSEYYDPTVEDSYRKHGKLNVKGESVEVTFDIFDTAGQEENAAVRNQYMSSADGYLCVYDITQQNSLRDAAKLYRVAQELKKDDKVPFVLVGNKLDLDPQREVDSSDGKTLAERIGCPFYETSAKNNQLVQEAFETLAGLVLDRQKSLTSPSSVTSLNSGRGKGKDKNSKDNTPRDKRQSTKNTGTGKNPKANKSNKKDGGGCCVVS
jgi:GTPase KRas protein